MSGRHSEITLQKLIPASIRGQAKALGQRFRQAQPFPHLVLDTFLDPEYCKELTATFPAFDRGNFLNEYGEPGSKAVFQNLPGVGPAYEQLDQLFSSEDFLSLLSELTEIPDLLYDPDYVGGGTHENLSGQGLDAHVDFNYHPKTGFHRRLNLLLYLNDTWEESWGGALELHLNPWLPPEQNRITTVLPLSNRCVIFETSERSWHGFRNIEKPDGRTISRRSIAAYFYTKERPATESAPRHATVYVHPKLPEKFAAGYTLNENDADMIRNLIDRRDQHMRFLYEREKEFSSHVDQLSSVMKNIARSPAFRFSRLLTWPFRRFR